MLLKLTPVYPCRAPQSLYNSTIIHAHTVAKHPCMHTIITLPSRQTPKLTVDTHFPMVILLFYTLQLTAQFNHFSHTHWVALQCEASKASTAMPTVDDASEATYLFHVCGHRYNWRVSIPVYYTSNVDCHPCPNGSVFETFDPDLNVLLRNCCAICHHPTDGKCIGLP